MNSSAAYSFQPPHLAEQQQQQQQHPSHAAVSSMPQAAYAAHFESHPHPHPHPHAHAPPDQYSRSAAVVESTSPGTMAPSDAMPQPQARAVRTEPYVGEADGRRYE
jgi:hypothetical protein